MESDEITIGSSGKPVAENQAQLDVRKIKENYGSFHVYEFKFYYESGESVKFRVDSKMYELMKHHFKKPRIH